MSKNMITEDTRRSAAIGPVQHMSHAFTPSWTVLSLQVWPVIQQPVVLILTSCYQLFNPLISGWYLHVHGKLASQEQEDAELALALAEASSLLYDPHLLDLGPDHFVQVSLHESFCMYMHVWPH